MKHKLYQYFQDFNIKNISFDSRNIPPSSAFFAIKGSKLDGNDYINQALASGANIVFTDNQNNVQEKVVFLENIRQSLAIAAGILYNQLPKNLIAVTGTNGKTSVVCYVHQILTLLGYNSASIGTLGINTNKKVPSELLSLQTKSLTTADPISFRKILHHMALNEIDNVAFEASSHGLDQKRLGDIKVTTAAFISFSQDHLDYHHNMHEYLMAKLSLFSDNLAVNGEVVINSEIDYFDQIQAFFLEHNINFFTVGLKGNLKILSNKQSIMGQEIIFSFNNKKYNIYTNIIGSFQATNLLIAIKLVHNLGLDFERILSITTLIKPVAGRLQRITNLNNPFHVFVDYAHTPDALEKSLTELKLVKGTSGKLVVIFGCGGDRDKQKRPIMGGIASKLADVVVITDDNPRSEKPEKIRQEIMVNAPGAIEIASRETAIRNIIVNLQKNDIVLIAGKGHEDYQIIGENITPFSDVEVALQALKINN